MTYNQELISYLKNTFGSLEGEYTEDFTNASILFHNAIELSKSKNHNERVLSIVLYHQSTIEMMKRLIIYSNFLVRILVYPNEIKFRKIRDEDHYSTIFNELDKNISFEQKDSLLNKIRELNSIRKKISHYMFKDDYEVFSFEELSAINELLESIFDKFQKGIYDLGNKIRVAKEREELIELLKDNE